jgi:hypothetical protein
MQHRRAAGEFFSRHVNAPLCPLSPTAPVHAQVHRSDAQAFQPFAAARQRKEVRLQLTQLFGELAQYLQATGKDLYPALAETPDPAARAEAARFSAEFKQMLPRLAEFNRRWSSAEAIRVQASAFLKEANELLTWLERRFAAESSGLLPLLDRLDAASAAPAKVQLARI